MDARRRSFRWPLGTDSVPRWLRSLPPGDRNALLAALLLCATGVPLALADTPIWWFGGALLLAAATLALRTYGQRLVQRAEQLRAPRSWRGLQVRPLVLAADGLCVGIVVWIGTTMLSEIAGGDRPIGGDHAVHYVRAFELHERLLPSGRLFGWSHDAFAGYPANYLDPPGAALWVNAVHALGLGLSNFSAAYAVAVLLCHLFMGLAMYRFGRMLAGPLVGLLAAVLCLTDLSASGMGGWTHAIEYGAWPQTLSLAFALMALCSVPAIASERRLAPLGAFGLWMGLAIVTHPIQLLVLVLVFVCTALAAGLADGVKAATALFRFGLSCALSLLVAAAWLIPFLGARGESNPIGVWWDSSYEIGRGLLELRALPGTLGWVLAFGALAIVLMLRTRRFALLLTALLALCIPAVSNSTFIDELHLPGVSRAFVQVQLVRLSSMVKPFWFVLAAYFVVAAVAHAQRLGRSEAADAPPPASHARAAVFAAVLGLLTLPVLVPAGQVFWTRHVRKAVVTESERPMHAAREQLERWLETQLPGDGFYRVGLFGGDDHELLDLATHIDRPIYEHGVTPASSFLYQMTGDDPAILEAVNLRFAISRRHLPTEQFEPLTTFGGYRLYRFKRWHPQPFRIDSGRGDVRVERFDDEEIVLRAAPGAHGKLRLAVSYFSRWRAYHDGRRVPMTLTYLREVPTNTGFMTVKLAPGLHRFAFERTLGDRLAIPLGLLGVVLCALLIAVDRREQRLPWLRRALAVVYGRLDRWSQPEWGRRRALLALAAGAVLLGAGIALASWRPPIALRELGAVAIRRVRYDFLENLARASANIEYRDVNQPCLRQRDRLVCRDEAGNLDNGRYVASSPAMIEEGAMVRCIRARPEAGALLSISYPDVPRGHAIVGYYGIERDGRLNQRRPVRFQIMVDGTAVYEGYTQADSRMHWFRADVPPGLRSRAPVAFSVRAENVNKRHFCFHAQMVQLD